MAMGEEGEKSSLLKKEAVLAAPIKTNSRIIARFLSRFSLYQPKSTGDDKPDLDMAWAHYENQVLVRHYADKEGMQRAADGDLSRPTSLYPFFSLNLLDRADFGVSVRIYFATLVALGSILFIAGCLNIPLMTYFSNYGDKTGIPITIVGSAICASSEWVECETCNEHPDEYPLYRLDGTNVLVNTCDFDNLLIPGLLSYAATISLLLLFGLGFDIWQVKAEVQYDEDIQTASDYSIRVNNPPTDATDPEEWRSFFSQFAERENESNEVISCTVALANEDLIAPLTERRKKLKNLSMLLPNGTDLKDESSLAEAVANFPDKGCFGLSFMSSNEARDQYVLLQDLEVKIKQTLESCNYDPIDVFVTFNTEGAQRKALTNVTVGMKDVWMNNLDAYASSSFLFRGKHVLDIEEAPEPGDLRYRDLQVTRRKQGIQFTLTMSVLFTLMALSGYYINKMVRDKNPSLPFFIVIMNILIPGVCNSINNYESHSTEGHRKCSLYVKIAMFRWFNSAIVLSIIFGFIETVSVKEGGEDNMLSLIYTIVPIINAELTMGPFLKVLDIGGIISKHMHAPRAKTQKEMNNYFSGSPIELSDLYTDATKVLFVALFYSAIFPGALFLGSLAIFIQYYGNKFCLLRQWTAAPDIGSHLSELSRNYFFLAAKVTHVLMSAYWWSGYPYDQVCRDEDGKGYYYCQQDLLRQLLPPLPRYQPDDAKWMTNDQELLTALYGWTAIIVIVSAIITLTKRTLWIYVQSLFTSTYEPDGEDQLIPFREVKHMFQVRGYIPQRKDPEFTHPLITCDIAGIDEDLIGWKDNFRGYDYHNLFVDACYLLGRKPEGNAFTIMKQWN